MWAVIAVGVAGSLAFSAAGCDSSEAPTAPRSPAGATTRGDVTGSWPMYRGGQSLVGVTDAELPDEMELLWRFRTGDAVRSSPAIADGRVFVGSDDGAIYAINAATGEKLWSHQTDDAVGASPCVLDGTVFVGSGDGFLYALAADSGEFRWKYETEDQILASANWVRPSGGARPS